MEKKLKKVLIVSYYWPPSGGAGVQRWVKLSYYLSTLGIKCYVLTVDDKKSSYSHIDASLLKDVHPEVLLTKTNSFEITNVYKMLFGAKKVPTSGFSNVDNSSFFQRTVNFIRSNFFVPDPRIGWNKFAIKEASKTIIEHKIDTVITTSPPHSSQLIGLELKKRHKIHWIADLRDPWTDIYYYPLLQHSKWSSRRNRKKENAVLENADKIITVSKGLVEGFLKKTSRIKEDKFEIIPNGFDPRDFESIAYEKDELLTISYTGTMSSAYQPHVFFDALKKVANEQKFAYIVKLIGSFSSDIVDYLEKEEINFDLIGMLPHSEIHKHQKEADLLLLVIPDIENSKGILTGKLFEYLASGNRIINIGPEDGDAAAIIEKCSSGKTFNRENTENLENYIKEVYDVFKQKVNFTPNLKAIEKFSRLEQAKEVYKLIK